MAYRHKFPKLEHKNIQFWFKNRRAKCKRLSTPLSLHPAAGTMVSVATNYTSASTSEAPSHSQSSHLQN